MLEAALRAAAEAGVTVRRCDLGAWPLLAEYDPASRTIAISERAYAVLRAARGETFAERFAAFAIRHELHHVGAGAGDERSAHAAAEAHTGAEARDFERALRELHR
jgi:hypothetical protein